MIQFSEILADAYVRPARNVAMPSQPGRQVKFLQGHAAIKDGRDLAAMLRRSDVLLVLTPYSSSWIEEIERAAGQIRAEVRRPERILAEPAEALKETEPELSKPESGVPLSQSRKPNAIWDPSWPRDPKTGRLMKREAVGTDSPEPDP